MHVLLAITCALAASAFAEFQEPAPASSAATAVDLSRERALVAEANAAFDASSYASAREKAAEAVTALLGRQARDQDSAWLALLDQAALAAWYAQDSRTARSGWERVLELRSATLPDDDLDLNWTRLHLSLTLKRTDQLRRARELCERALAAFERTLPDDHEALLTARYNLGAMLGDAGDFAAAERLFASVVEIRSRKLPPGDPQLLRNQSNLAAARMMLGDLLGARALEERVLDAFTRLYPEQHLALLNVRANYANTLQALGDVQGARALQERVLEVASELFPDDDKLVQGARVNLANTLFLLGEHEPARALLEKALAVYADSLPDDHADLQRLRVSLGAVLDALGDRDGAWALFERVLEVRTELLPDDHPELQIARNDVAKFAATSGDLPRARDLFEQVLAARSRSLPDEHPDLQTARASVAGTIARTVLAAGERLSDSDRAAERERCRELALALCHAQTRAARQALVESSVREAERRCERIAGSLGTTLSFAQGYGVFEPMPELVREAFVLSETTRAVGLDSAALMRAAEHLPRYEELRASLRTASDELARLARAGTTSEAFRSALERRESVERALIELARSGGAAGLEFDPSALAARLDERTAAVGYRRYSNQRVVLIEDAAGKPTPRPRIVAHLCAFVLRRSAPGVDRDETAQSLEYVDLGPTEPIDSALRAYRAELVRGGASRGIAGLASAESESGELHAASELRRLVFDPLIPKLDGIEHLIVAQDDALHLVPLDALPLEDVGGAAQTLGDRWRIEVRSTLAELVVERDAVRDAGGGVVVGGADYGEDSAAFAPLPGAALEARAVARAFESSRGDDARLEMLGAKDATRERLAASAPSTRWLHIATHGWHAPESVRSWSDAEPLDQHSGLGARASGTEQIRGASPLLLCGLALSNANAPVDATGRAPGILTADELATWDLSNCELAVLSACDTNVGERRAGQGVASLQRALHMAGARSAITSLWKVPDEATRELMAGFYRRLWIEHQPKWHALWEAKRELRDARDSNGAPIYTTRDWAAWVLTGDPE